MEKNQDIGVIKGVGVKTKALLNKLGINTIEDIINYYPKAYVSYEEPIKISDINIGEKCVIKAVINSYIQVKQVKNLKIINCSVRDSSAELSLTWFNMPFLKNIFYVGQTYIFIGTVIKKGERLVMEQPEYFSEEDYQKKMTTMQPVYNLTKGITNNFIQKMLREVFNQIDLNQEYLTDDILQKYDLLDYNNAIYEIHFPKDKDNLKNARNRLVFDEFFKFLVSMQKLKDNSINRKSIYEIKDFSVCDELIQKLPFSLTNAQIKAFSDIKNDLSENILMNRLIQGDVGSGKTIIAILSLLAVVKAGYQGALMVPTEVLAIQHYENFAEILKDFNVRIEFLTSSVTAKAKREIYRRLKYGITDIIIGTHALIQENVEYKSLALVITDEQHRFGVRQREELALKGYFPHILVMSATPIPRTLAIVLYGDLQVSVINELPANRLPIKNSVVDKSYRIPAYKFIKKELEKGRQAYVICPMVEENELLDLENVIDYTKKLKKYLPENIVIECIHGRMKANQKEEIMDKFSKNQIQVLVSTTVIEVGINVPNATVMMVENAERFGLAQLHQLRGRVGRGNYQSYCIFISTNNKKGSMERLQILKNSNDGFYIANEDLKLRGAGDFFGIRQSGDMDFALADIYSDTDILIKVKTVINELEKINFDFDNLYRDLIETLTI